MLCTALAGGCGGEDTEALRSSCPRTGWTRGPVGGGCGLRVLAQYVCNGCQEIDGAEPPDAALDRAGFHRKSGPASSARFGMDDGDAEAIAVVLCPDVPSLVA